jgi:hypothetical protein
MTADDCRYCRGTGWITCVDYDGSGYEIACPEGCPAAAPSAASDEEAAF